MPSWKELKRFCDHDGWEMYNNSDHFYYRKTMDNGILKRTKVSKGSGQIPAKLWKYIQQHQLQVEESYFNKLK